MRLLHVSPVPLQLLCFGLDPAFSKGRKRVSWLCEPWRLQWAIAHVMRRHKLNFEPWVLEVTISKTKVRRWRAGLWYTRVHVQCDKVRLRASA